MDTHVVVVVGLVGMSVSIVVVLFLGMRWTARI